MGEQEEEALLELSYQVKHRKIILFFIIGFLTALMCHHQSMIFFFQQLYNFYNSQIYDFYA